MLVTAILNELALLVALIDVCKGTCLIRALILRHFDSGYLLAASQVLQSWGAIVQGRGRVLILILV